MASFEGSIGTPSGGFNLKVEYSISQSVSGNYSDVTATGYVKRNNSSYYPYNSSSSASLSINGTAKSYTGSYNLGSDGYKTITSNTVRVYHNSDGTKSITISFSFNGKLSSYYPNGSISKTIALPTIPRASEVACSSPYIGDTATITISKKSSSFTSTVSYDIGGIKGTIASKTPETVLSLPTEDLADSIYALIPTSKSAKGTITCQTYNGSTLIGTKTATFYLYAKEEECKPDVSGTVIDTNEKTIALTGNSSKLIKYASKPKVRIEATAKKNATISSYSINLNDGQTSTLQEETFESIGSNTITVNATDSRGYSNPQTIELEMIDYVKLHIDNIDISRTEDVSNEVLLNANGVWFNGNFNDETANTLAASFQYKLSDSTEWIDRGTITPTIEGNTFKFTDVSLGNTYDYNNEYQFKIILSDLLLTVGSENKEAITVPKGQEVVAIGEDSVWVYGDLFLNDENILDNFGKTEVVWEGTLLGDNEINVDLTDCQRIRVYASAFYGNFVFEIDLTKEAPAVYISGYPYIGGETTRTTDLGTSFYTCLCCVNSEKTKFRHLAVGYGNANGWNSRINTNNYYVYKIEKVGITEITHKHEFESNEIYSMEEQRIGTWVNGKPIYRKTYIFGEAKVNVGNNVDVSSLNIDEAIRLDGMSKSSEYPAIPMNYYNDDKRNCIYINKQTMIYVVGWDADQVTINIEYTKTTD